MGRPGKRLPIVGIFVEGNVRDRTRDSIGTLWNRLAARCNAPVEIRVYGIEKSQIVALFPTSFPVKHGATRILSRRETLDVAIDRAHRNDHLTHIVVAFDAWPPNEMLDPNGRRQEIGFLLTGLQASEVLADTFKAAAGLLAERYATEGCLEPRGGELGPLEVLYMEPMFEALLVSDESTVRNALGHSSYPKDWPKFKTSVRELDKHVIAPAVEVAHKEAHRKMGGSYFDRKTAWALLIVESAEANAALWRHEIASRLCRILCNLSVA
jgi:hypothetical protein